MTILLITALIFPTEGAELAGLMYQRVIDYGAPIEEWLRAITISQL